MARWQYQIKTEPLEPTSKTLGTGLAVYPDRLRPVSTGAHLTGAFAWDPVHRPDAISAWVTYPDRLQRPASVPPTQTVLDPLPIVYVSLLSAWAIYPDRITRATLLAAQQQAFVPGPLEPIPTPPSAYRIEDRVLIGQNQSIETPAYPSIGGSSTWS